MTILLHILQLDIADWQCRVARARSGELARDHRQPGSYHSRLDPVSCSIWLTVEHLPNADAQYGASEMSSVHLNFLVTTSHLFPSCVSPCLYYIVPHPALLIPTCPTLPVSPCLLPVTLACHPSSPLSQTSFLTFPLRSYPETLPNKHHRLHISTSQASPMLAKGPRRGLGRESARR